MISGEIADLVAARRWLDGLPARRSVEAGKPDWRDQSAVLDACRIGAALTTQGRQAEACAWLNAAASAAPPRLLADIGGYLVHAGDLSHGEAALRRGAQAGDAESSLHLGRLLLFAGRDEEAGRWLGVAMEADPQTTHFLLRDLRERAADDLADRWAVLAAELGDAPAAVELAWSAARRGDDAEAERWLDWAGQLGHAGLWLDRLGIALARDDEASARRWLEAAAEEGDPGAQVGLGLQLLKEGNETAGWAMLRRAADAGEVLAQLQLAARAGSDGNRDELVRWMLAAAASDPAEASAIHETLLSAGQDELAEQLLRVCVDRGHDSSRVPLGRLLVRRGALADAVDVVQPAAEAGLEEAGVLLGLAEEKRGRIDQARYAYRRAAAAGDGRAAHKLGMLSLREGDQNSAWQFFLEGARAGEASSLFNLADMDPSPQRSARWLVLAAAHGHPSAALRVGSLEVAAGRVEEGARWFQRAVELGEPQAGVALASLRARVPSLRSAGGARGKDR